MIGYFKVVEVDGYLRTAITDSHGNIRKFTLDKAKSWIAQHSYKGMSFKYFIEEYDDE